MQHLVKIYLQIQHLSKVGVYLSKYGTLLQRNDPTNGPCNIMNK